MLNNIRCILISGFCLAGMSIASGPHARAAGVSHQGGHLVQDSGESMKNPNSLGPASTVNDLKRQDAPHLSPFIVTPPVSKPSQRTIRFGRLELSRKVDYAAPPDRPVCPLFDPLKMIRANAGVLPTPPIKILFDMKWRAR